jgi:uncharacterized protein (TIGR00369 family)
MASDRALRFAGEFSVRWLIAPWSSRSTNSLSTPVSPLPVHVPGGRLATKRNGGNREEMGLQMDAEALARFLEAEFPQTSGDFVIEEVREMGIRVRMPVAERHLRPGGTVSGPSMFALADVSVYLAVLAMIGPKALAVTTNCSIDFMRKPAARTDLVCVCRLLKARSPSVPQPKAIGPPA